MTHLITIENTQGDIVDAIYYCSDGCARTHPNWAGWNGCHEIHDSPQWCGNCGVALGYYTSEGEWISPEEQNRPDTPWDIDNGCTHDWSYRDDSETVMQCGECGHFQN